MSAHVVVGSEVAQALEEGRPVVALESTIFSQLGLPEPANAEALERSLAAVRARGAVPAVTAVIDGEAVVGVEAGAVERILSATAKVAERDLPVAIGQAWPVGVTTVSASLALAARVGISVFATGGIGGVHRDAATSGDISADLVALARHPVACVSAGAKGFLDLARTLEDLETRGVPVVGYRSDEFPAFWSRRSGLGLSHRVEEMAELVAVVAAALELPGRGVLVANPVPEGDELARELIEPAIESALERAGAQGIAGPAVTPVVLAHLAEVTQGRTLPANLALAEHNAMVAAELAVGLGR